MAKLAKNLEVSRCPHCSVASPHLLMQHHLVTENHAGDDRRYWIVYSCQTCGGVTTAWSYEFGAEVIDIFPSFHNVSGDVPERPRAYLNQAQESLHAPAGSIMLAASAVDSMLKNNDLKEGSLYERIDKAAAQHLITPDMAEWAHEVRLEANDQRHADEQADLPGYNAARRTLDFAIALADLLFVLPKRVQRGIQEASKS